MPFEPLKTYPTDPAQIEAAFNAATTPEQRRLLLVMLHGYQDGLKIDCRFALNEDGSKVSHIVCQYPFDLIAMLATRGPAGEAPERLIARGCVVNVNERDGGNVLTVAWPMVEALKLAKIWRDDADTDEATLSVVVPTPKGAIMGTLEPM
jgi:hypothetical protein